jgi:hypothetical protein
VGSAEEALGHWQASGLGVHLGCDPKEKTFIIDGKIEARGIVCDMDAF